MGGISALPSLILRLNGEVSRFKREAWDTEAAFAVYWELTTSADIGCVCRAVESRCEPSWDMGSALVMLPLRWRVDIAMEPVSRETLWRAGCLWFVLSWRYYSSSIASSASI